MKLAFIPFLSVITIAACSNPECGEDQLRLGKTCLAKHHEDAGAVSDAATTLTEGRDGSETTPGHAMDAATDDILVRMADASVINSATPPRDAAAAGETLSDGSTLCAASTEACDSIDNDCDGIVDNHDACAPVVTVKQISVGSSHACAVLSNGTIKCWGSNEQGQLGVPVAKSLTATFVPGVTTVVQVAAGFMTTCALLADGTVNCWGSGQHGGLGDGGKDPAIVSPKAVPGLTDVEYLGGTGGDRRCVVHRDGTVSCWYEGAPALLFPGISGAIKATPGQFQGAACALLPAGNVQCWRADSSSLGGGTGPDFASGSTGNCIVTDGAVKCWGSYQGGVLGRRLNADEYYSYAPELAGRQLHVAVGGGDGACAIAESGAVSCWASCESSPADLINNAGVDKSGGETFKNIYDAVEISAGGFLCIRRLSGVVSCWSNSCTHPNNISGELGDGTTADQWGVVDVVDLP